MGERRLIQRLKLGDTDAAARLVHKHYAHIYRMLARLTRDTHRAEDLCQETFATAWTKIGSFSEKCALRTWLHQIAYRRFLDWARARKNQASDELLSEPMEPRDPLAGALTNERQRTLLAGLDRLEEIDRHVLVLRYLQQMKFNEVAAILQQPERTLRWRASVALKRLRKILEDTEIRDVRQRKEPGPETSASAVTSDSASA